MKVSRSVWPYLLRLGYVSGWVVAFGVLATSRTSLPHTTAPPSNAGSHAPTFLKAPVFVTTHDSAKLDRPNDEPKIKGLNPRQEAALLAEVSRLPDFPDYPYGGCQDRAHAVYLLLPKWQEYLAKVWLFAGGTLSPAFKDSIQYTPPGKAPVSWDFHTAVVYRRALADGHYLVLDPVLTQPLRPLPLDAWFAHFQIPPSSVYTMLPGQLYSFNTNGSSKCAKNRQFFNGNFFAYEGQSKTEGWIPNSLARDAAGAWALHHADCPALNVRAILANKLASYLQHPPPDSNASPACYAYLTTYRRSRAFWSKQLAPVP